MPATSLLRPLALGALLGSLLGLTGCQSLLNSRYADSVHPDQGVVRIQGLGQNVVVRRNALGMPLIAGPASITTMLVLAQNAKIGFWVTLAALAANLVIVVFALHYSDWLGRKIGATGMRAISKIVSMLLAAIAVAMIRQGLRT